MHTLLLIFRILSYFAFAMVGTAALIVAVTEMFNLCPGFSANTGLSCHGAWYQGIANAAMGIVMMSLLSLVPAALAVAGFIFVIKDLVRWRRGRKIHHLAG